MNNIRIRSNVSMLGKVLGETIEDASGEHILERIKTIRKLSDLHALAMMLTARSYSPPYKICRTTSCCPLRVRLVSCTLNLANTAEQYHSIWPKGEAASNPEVITRTLRKLKNQPELSEDTIKKAVRSLSLELVLTAHPTRNYPSYTDPQNGGSERLLEPVR
ncbi:phosphoenolpyruvate carboxylase [Escherichia coli]